MFLLCPPSPPPPYNQRLAHFNRNAIESQSSLENTVPNLTYPLARLLEISRDFCYKSSKALNSFSPIETTFYNKINKYIQFLPTCVVIA